MDWRGATFHSASGHAASVIIMAVTLNQAHIFQSTLVAASALTIRRQIIGETTTTPPPFTREIITIIAIKTLGLLQDT
jgi:hypothetical protein